MRVLGISMGMAWLVASSCGTVSAGELLGITFHAAQFAGNAKVVADDTALSGKAVHGTRWYYFCRDVPFPQGPGEYHVYLRVKTEGQDNPIEVAAVNDGKLKVLAKVPAPAAGRWTWIKFAPLEAKAVGPWLAVHGGGAQPQQWTLLDGLVISRRADLTPTALGQLMADLPADVGLLAVPRAVTPPVLDGVPDDACYRSAPEAYPFVRVGEPRFAEAQTRVWAAWDTEHLYVAARLDEPILATAANRRGDFRQQVQQHDGPVSNDDCFELYVDPSCRGTSLCRIVANARGTIYDARENDPSFESGTKARTVVGDGRWWIELAIPLAPLGIKDPREGLLAGVAFGRRRQAGGEISSWTPVAKLGERTGLARCALLGKPSAESPAPRVSQYELFRMGDNLVSLAGPGSEPVTAFLEARPERGKPIRVVASAPSGSCPVPLDLRCAIAESGRATAQLLVIADRTSSPLYRSPAYPGEVAGTFAEVNLRGDGDLNLFLNGEQVATAPAGQPLVANLPLVDGLSALAVRNRGSVLDGRIRAGSFELSVDSTWCWFQDPHSVSRSLDLATAERVRVNKDGRLQAPGSGGVFRKSLAVHATEAWPNYGPAMHLALGTAQWFHLKLKGIRGLAALKTPVVVVDVPEGIELVDGAGYYGKKRDAQPRFKRRMLGKVQHEGVRLERTVFASDLAIRTRGQASILNLFSVVLRARKDGPLRPGQEATLFYHVEDADGSIAELPRPLKLRIAEPLAGVQPAGLTFQCWPGWWSTYDGQSGKEALLETMAKAGFNDASLGEDASAAHRHGMRMTALVNFKPWVLDLAPYVRSHPEAARTDAAGKRSKDLLCTTRLLGDGWDACVKSALAGWLDRMAPDHVNWDYESSAFTGELACYDQPCLAAFRKSAGLSGEVPLNAELIRTRYRQPWIDFMAGRSAEVARRFRQSIRQHRPTAIFSMYSGYQGPDTKERYNVDWKLCAPHLDLVMTGYGRRTEEVEATRQAAGKTPCVFGSITYPYEYDDDKVVTTISPAEVLRRLCEARGGVLYYSLSNGDARTLHAFAKISQVASAFAQFFTAGQLDRTAVKTIQGNANDVYVFSHRGQVLLCLMNESAKPARFELECPNPVRDFFAKDRVLNKRPAVNLAPGEVAVYASAP